VKLSMCMHEVRRVDSSTSVVRVPGGLLYRTVQSGRQGDHVSVHTMFVPLFDSVENDPLLGG
jgi:hypothetical protein